MKTLISTINEKLRIEIKTTPKERKQIQTAIYKELEKNNTTGKFYHDDYWYGVDAVRKDIDHALNVVFTKTRHEYDVSVYANKGGYRKSNDGMAQWKEYIVDITIKGKDTPFMRGYLNCHAAGKVDNPFETYDMSFVLSSTEYKE